MHFFSFLCVALLAAPLTLGGCATVPGLDQPFQTPEKVQIRDVVARVQCEMQKTVTEEIENHPRLIWLAAWSARVHMTLIVDDTASLTPGVLVTAPFHNAYATVAGPTSLGGTTIGAIPQFFSLGLGGGASTEAVRTEDLEFDLSFKELAKNFKDGTFVSDLHDCVLGDHLLLDGDLGLYEWMDAALGPAADKNQILKIGKNPPPGGGGVAFRWRSSVGI